MRQNPSRRYGLLGPKSLWLSVALVFAACGGGGGTGDGGAGGGGGDESAGASGAAHAGAAGAKQPSAGAPSSSAGAGALSGDSGAGGEAGEAGASSGGVSGGADSGGASVGGAPAGGGVNTAGAPAGGAPAVCGDGTCNGAESKATCCTDCGCDAGSACKAGKCTPNDHVIACSSVNGKDWDPDCTCSAQDTNSGAPKYTGVACANKLLDPDFCCQDSTYPKSGSCSCYPGTNATNPALWSCLSGGAEFCQCGYGTTGGSSFACDATPEPNGTKWICCGDPSDGTCYCQQAKFGGCVGGSTSIAACTNAPAGWKPKPKSCPSGTSVGACNPTGAQCTKDADCGSGCTGSDPFCCPTCSAGKCKTCCTSGGSVSCF